MKKAAEVMPAATARLFTELEKEPLLQDFILIGGTALALHLGHRKSEDLDYITLRKKLPRAVLTAVVQKLELAGHTIVPNDSPQSLDDFEIAGMDLRDYSQDYLVGGVVKVTFFTADSHHAGILGGAAAASGDEAAKPGIATLEQLSQLKAIVASGRSKSRDWIDLYILEKEHGFGLEQWRQAYEKAGLTDSQLETGLNRICSGVVVADDEGFDALLPNPPAVQEIADHFKKLRREYEAKQARKKLNKG
jgi:hypothetical protein